MRTDMERIKLLHQKARELHDQKMMRVWGSAAGVLLAVLVALIVHIDVPLQSIASNGLAASSLLGESAGGYVLVAVISFVAAVCFTVYCIKMKDKNH